MKYEEAKKIAEANGEELVRQYCPMCGPKENCRIYAFLKDGKITRIAGMTEASKNRGARCAEGLAAPEWQYSPDRIKNPLLRVGEKGEGKFKEISWDEAIQITADKLREQKEKYGPETLAILSPGARSYKEISLRFLAVHGSPNHSHSGICAMQNAFSYCYTLGEQPKSDFEHADLVIYWGRQPVLSGPSTERGRSIIGAKNRKAKIACVKPSKEQDVAWADIWVPIRPGTDAALALAMLHVITKEDLIDHEFVEKWCYGYDKLAEHVKQYSPEWAENITGVSAQQIIDFARLYATTPKACIETGNGLEHSASASSTVRSIASLMAITGHLDREGGNLFGPPGGIKPKNIMRFDLYTDELVDKLVAPEMPKPFMPFKEGPASSYARTLDAVLTGKPYKPRTIIALGTQPLVSTRGTARTIEALKAVDFFITVDVMKMAEWDYADLILPTATHFEAEMPFGIDGNTLVYRPGCIEPLGDYKTIYHFFIEVADKLGYGDDFWHGSFDEFENFRLEPFGITVDELRKHPEGIAVENEKKPKKFEKYEKTFNSKRPGPKGLPFLAQGKVALYNTTFEEAGYEPLPTYREPELSLTNATEEELKKYPLLLSDYHTSRAYSASWLRNIPSLRQIQPEPVVEIHPSQAEKRGIKTGDKVKVEGKHGYLIVKAEVTEIVRPDTVMILHGWWQGCSELGIEDLPMLDGGANVNHIYDISEKSYDPLVTANSSQALVEVTKIE
ncbi:MAG: molybdopterin-dependent oxidoreductase [Clostridia bacterium]|nr:molybdopterin-dependent oxidoreductase [Clostridia bacterium]